MQRKRRDWQRGVVNVSRCFFVCVTILIITGCNVKEVGRTVGYSIKGDYYLDVDDPGRGEDKFRQEVELNPESPLTNYYYGRLLLRSEKIDQAIPYLEKSIRLDPYKADYHFWMGVAYGAKNRLKAERDQYEKALVLNSKHLNSLTYLGHHHLKAKRYNEALDLYVQALQIWPESPSVLYNRGLVLSRLGRTPEERLAWKEYLAVVPSGALAIRAVDHLNRLNDFSYRNYYFGPRTVMVPEVTFEPFSAQLTKSGKESLGEIGKTAVLMKKGSLQVVVYQKNNKKLAEQRAKSIRAFLYQEYPGLKSSKLGISWFNKPQKVAEKRWNIEESVDFFIL